MPSCTGLNTTNAAYSGPDNRTPWITKSATGTILQARIETPGLTLFSHL
jgi:gluconolactonase